jgi:hypothetical protein
MSLKSLRKKLLNKTRRRTLRRRIRKLRRRRKRRRPRKNQRSRRSRQSLQSLMMSDTHADHSFEGSLFQVNSYFIKTTN